MANSGPWCLYVIIRRGCPFTIFHVTPCITYNQNNAITYLTSYILKKLIPTTSNSLNMQIVHIIIMPHQLLFPNTDQSAHFQEDLISLFLKRKSHIHLRHPLFMTALLPSLSLIALNSSPSGSQCNVVMLRLPPYYSGEPSKVARRM